MSGKVEQVSQLDQKLTGLLAEILQIPAATITDDLAMAKIDVWDSLKHMELIAALEESFSIQLTFDDIVAMQNVREIRRVLRQRGVSD
jgi:acyl carrier protein